jgi:putative ABC transport system ATP-binding protein
MVTHSMAQALHYGDRTVMFHRGKIIFDVSGEKRAALTVPDMLDLFKRDQGEELSDDALLLG